MDFERLSRFVAGRVEASPAGDWDDSSGVFRLLEDMGEESEGMKADLIRCFRNPLYWLVLSAGLFVRVVLAYLISRPAAMCSGRYPQSSGIRQAP